MIKLMMIITLLKIFIEFLNKFLFKNILKYLDIVYMGNYWYYPEKNKYGWKRDKSTENDVYHNFSISESHSTVKVIDLRNKCPPIYDQGKLGSCTANAIAAAYAFDMLKQNEENIFEPSRLFIYYNERKANNTIDDDSGASIKDSVMEIAKVGVCPESMWEYDITKFKMQPTDECYTCAQNHVCISYKRVNQTLEQLKQCLIEGFPFVFGIDVYESFESDEVKTTGVVPMPGKGEKLLGGHALALIGFIDEKQCFIFRNSWGEGFGEKGYGYIPYEYVLDKNLAADFWTVRVVKDE